MLICKKPRIFDIDLLAVLLLIGLGTLVWLVLFMPLNKKIIQQRQDQVQHRDSKGSAQIKLDHLQGLSQREQALAAWLQQTRNILDDSTGVAEVIKDMEDLCHLCDLRLDEISPIEKTTTEHFRKTGLNISLSGTFPQAKELLTRIKQELPYVRIRSLSVVIKDAPQRMCEIIMLLDIFSPRKYSR